MILQSIEPLDQGKKFFFLKLKDPAIIFDLWATFAELVPLTLCSTSRSPDVTAVSLSLFFAGFSSPALILRIQAQTSSLLRVDFHYQKPAIPTFPIIHPSSTAVSIIQLHPCHHHWLPHRHLKLTMFQTDLMILLPNQVLHLDGLVQCREPSGTACSAFPLMSSKPPGPPACSTGNMSLKCIHFSQSI